MAKVELQIKGREALQKKVERKEAADYQLP